MEVDIIDSDNNDDDDDGLNGVENTSIANCLDTKTGNGGIWDYINRHCDRKERKNREDIQTHGSIHIPALVKRSQKTGSEQLEGKSEMWDFVFVPLRYETEYVPKYGCACTCFGPRIETSHDIITTLNEERMEEYHQPLLRKDKVNMCVKVTSN